MMSRETTLRNHLKHLLFIDAMITHSAGMNNNAMDRSCVYDRFLENIQNMEFDRIYDETLRRYWKEKDGFEKEPMTEIIERWTNENGEKCEDVIWRQTGYWDSVEDVEKYANEYATDNAVSTIMKKIYEPDSFDKPHSEPPTISEFDDMSADLLSDPSFFNALRAM